MGWAVGLVGAGVGVGVGVGVGGRGPGVVRRRRRCTQACAHGGSTALPRTWSNPTGSVLTPVVAGRVWAAERPFVWNGIDVGGKMAVVRLEDGSLWVHSPVELDGALAEAVDALGPVRHVVSPNFEHVKWAAQWKAAYPSATLYGCPGMRAKKPGIPWDAEVGEGPGWGGEVAHVAFEGCERNPFTGTPFFNEVVFFHAPTGVVFVTDLFWNYPDARTTAGVPAGTSLWKLGMDKVYLPFYRRAMVHDPTAFRTAIEAVLAWPFDAMLPCHGTFVARGAKSALRRHLLP